MRTITITIPEGLDRRARVEAERRGISKSELIRLGLAAVLPAEGQAQAQAADPWVTLAGLGSPGVSAGPGEIDAVVYGQ